MLKILLVYKTKRGNIEATHFSTFFPLKLKLKWSLPNAKRL